MITSDQQSKVEEKSAAATAAAAALSIIVPTFNESENIIQVLEAISKNLPSGISTEILVVDDNSPDGTGLLAEEYAKKVNDKNGHCRIRIIHRKDKKGLSSAILAGIMSSVGAIVLVMDSDFSHPPETIPMMYRELDRTECDMVVASRYIQGGSVRGWPLKRRLISKGATKIAQHGLGVNIKDPMSGFFAFKRTVVEGVRFDAIGYKLLLEILVKKKGLRINEIPYTFTDRTAGASKLHTSTIVDYTKAVWRLYLYGRSARERETRASVRFLSKAGRFYSVGAIGLAINYIVSSLFSTSFPAIGYLYATVIGIMFSIVSNFFLNKLWTFEDKNFKPRRRFVIQFVLFATFSSLGALVQLSLLYAFVYIYGNNYAVSLVTAVAVASVSNFLLNKKLTFKERVWG